VNTLRRLAQVVAVIGAASALAWATWGFYAWAVVMLAGAAVVAYLGVRRPRPGLPPDASADAVNVGSVPNVPIAELLVSELKQNGIEAFYKLRGVGFYARSSVSTPEEPCDIYVAERDAGAARAFVAGSTTAAKPARPDRAARRSPRR
jgi:hypothetical protein